MDYAIWNTLHDGSIDSIDGVVPGDVHVCVGIAYLTKMLPTAADYVVVHLRGCRQFEYRPFDEAVVSELPEIAAADVEVLSGEEVCGSVSVVCVAGYLKLAYDRVDLSLVEGRVITQAELEGAADRYWTKWEENAKRRE
jgi:hypothetical protein